MESDATPRESLATVERAAATLWTRYAPTPWWYFPAAGAWSAGLVLAVGGLGDTPLLLAVTMAVLVAALGLFSGWYTRYRGAMPRVGSAPAEFRPAIVGFVAGAVLLAGVILLVDLTLGYPVAALLAFIGVTAGLVVYERAYESSAAATRDRLG